MTTNKFSNTWSDDDLKAIAKDAEKAKLVRRLYKTTIHEYYQRISEYNTNIVNLINTSFSTLTVASIISLIVFTGNQSDFLSIYLLYVFPFLSVSTITTLILVIKRKYISIAELPVVVSPENKISIQELLVLKGTVRMYQSIAKSAYKNFHFLLNFFWVIVASMVAFFVSFLFHFYLFVFDASLTTQERIAITLGILGISVLFCDYLIKKKKNFKKTITIKSD